MIYLWTIKNSEIELNLKEILKYKQTEYIYARDKMNGKDRAKQEFKYIDFMSNRDSFPIREGLSYNDSHKFAVLHSGLPKDYTADKYVKEAIELCKTLNGGVIETLIDSTVAAFRVDANLMAKIKIFIQDLEDKVITVEGVNEIVKLTDTIITMSGKIPGKITSLLTLRDEYDKQVNKIVNEKRGGGEISSSFDGGGFEQSTDSGEVEKVD